VCSTTKSSFLDEYECNVLCNVLQVSIGIVARLMFAKEIKTTKVRILRSGVGYLTP